MLQSRERASTDCESRDVESKKRKNSSDRMRKLSVPVRCSEERERKLSLPFPLHLSKKRQRSQELSPPQPVDTKTSDVTAPASSPKLSRYFLYQSCVDTSVNFLTIDCFLCQR